MRLIASALSLAVILPFSGGALAEFSLNWTRINTTGPVGPGCLNPTCSLVSQQENDEDIFAPPGQTPFVYERVQDPQSGLNYYHMIVGDPEQGFAQEVFIQVGTRSDFQGVPPLQGGFSSSSGGQPPVEEIARFSSGGNPLANDQTFTGTGTGNPSRVQMRQLMTDADGGLTVDFVKNRYLEKPTISNTIDASDVNMSFIIDGSGNLYTTPAPSAVTNIVEHRGANVPPDASARFDMATDAPNAHVTAGQYTTTNPAAGDPGGPYTYADPLENVPLSFDDPVWSNFFDHREANPWSYPENRPSPPPP